MTKECCKCKEVKELVHFFRKGKATICKSCDLARQKVYRTANTERIRSIQKRYDDKNKVSHREKCRKYRRLAPNSRILTMAKYRARLKGLPFNLELADIVIPKTCPVLGIPLLVSETGRQNDYSPSLDRIIPSKGYVRGNVMVISSRANVIKNCGTVEEHERVIAYIKLHT